MYKYLVAIDGIIKNQLDKCNKMQHSKVKNLYLTIQAILHEDVWRGECIDPHFFDLDGSWRKVFNFRTSQLYSLRKSPRYRYGSLGEPQSRCGRLGDVKVLEATGIRTSTPLSSSP
jgi:hypothetical protein